MSHFSGRASWLSFNSKWSGREAGSESFSNGKKSGIRVKIGRVSFLVHRVIMSLIYGGIPTGMVVDHIDGDAFNNALTNLRFATFSQNSHNSKPRKSHLPKGVFKSRNRLRVIIGIGNKQIYVGTFDDVDEASRAYQRAATRLHGEYAKS